MSVITDKIKSVKEEEQRQRSAAPHVIVVARAGTGKTTTLVEGLKIVRGMETSLTPSPQQAAVWEQMALSSEAQSVCFAAFNRSIRDELQSRVPEGCDALTMHSLGSRALRGAFPRAQMKEYKVQDILSELVGIKSWDLKKKRPEFVNAICEFANLCRMNLLDGTREDILLLLEVHDIDVNSSLTDIIDYLPRVLQKCQDVARYGYDYADMIWVPVVLNLSVKKYDLLLVDEAQDLSHCQQQLALMSGSRLIFCGDNRQAIYAFAGADSGSLTTLESLLYDTPNGVVTLPLTVTRRCGQAIVAEAQQYVPDFEAHETNNPGAIKESTVTKYRAEVQAGDMILCRVNAPLVKECFGFLKEGRRANIQGRDVGTGLFSVMKRAFKQQGKDAKLSKKEDWYNFFSSVQMPEFLAQLSEFVENETRNELAKAHPNERKIDRLNDQYACLVLFGEGCSTARELLTNIDTIFTDSKTDGVLLSSIHKAKGLEANNVYLLRLKDAPIPHPMATSPEAQAQELNLLYIAITRAIKQFTYVYSE